MILLLIKLSLFLAMAGAPEPSLPPKHPPLISEQIYQLWRGFIEVIRVKGREFLMGAPKNEAPVVHAPPPRELPVPAATPASVPTTNSPGKAPSEVRIPAKAGGPAVRNEPSDFKPNDECQKIDTFGKFRHCVKRTLMEFKHYVLGSGDFKD